MRTAEAKLGSYFSLNSVPIRRLNPEIFEEIPVLRITTHFDPISRRTHPYEEIEASYHLWLDRAQFWETKYFSSTLTDGRIDNLHPFSRTFLGGISFPQTPTLPTQMYFYRLYSANAPNILTNLIFILYNKADFA